jgi:predicted DNA-binding transcriptional regulator YafY
LRSALRKVFAALPESLRSHAAAATQATVFDPLGWGRAAEEPPLLDDVRSAVLQRVQVDIDYAKRGAPPEPRRVQPYGLIAKGGVWYLLAGTAHGRRTFRVSRVRAVRPTTLAVELPPSFDLAAEWASAQRDFLGALQVVRVELEVAVDAVLAFTSGLRGWAGVEEVGGESAEWRTIVTMVPSIRAAAAHLASFGAAVRVKSPPELREEVLGIAEGLLEANRRGS